MTLHENGVRTDAMAPLRPGASAAVLDGDRVQILGVLFRAEVVEGTAGLSDEVTEVGWFTAAEAAELTVIANHRPLLPTAYGVAEIYFNPPRPSTA